MPAAVGVMLAEHDEVVPVPASVHVPLGVNVTVPDGTLPVPAAVSVTVAVQDVAWLTNTVEGVHETVVVVVRRLTVTLVPPLLVACVVDPP